MTSELWLFFKFQVTYVSPDHEATQVPDPGDVTSENPLNTKIIWGLSGMFWKNVSPKIYTLDSDRSKACDKSVRNLGDHLAHEDRGTRVEIEVHTNSLPGAG